MLDLNKSYDYFHPEDVKGRIHIIGCGSVGGTLAENLVRFGITQFTLWDFDKVEAHNLANQVFRAADVGRPKVEALLDILAEIDPDVRETVKLKPEGWNGQQLSGYVFLCVDNIDVRRRIVEQHMTNPNVKLVMDFRTLLEGAQHYAADWGDVTQKENLLATMQFSHEEAVESAPVSACGYTLGVNPTVRAICAVGAANFVNFIRGRGLKTMVNFNVFGFLLDAFPLD